MRSTKDSSLPPQAAGVAAFLTTVLGYGVCNRLINSPWYRTSRIKASERSTAIMPAAAEPTFTYRVGLLDLLVPTRRSKDYTNLLLANDIAIEKAVQAVGDALYVYIHEPEGAGDSTQSDIKPSPEARRYLSELYGQFWDVCYLHRNLQVDVRILYHHGPSSSSSESGSPRTPRDRVLMRPDLQVVFCSRFRDEERINAKRVEREETPVVFMSLDQQLSVAMTSRFHFVEDDMAEIPQFANVAVGGTFDRLHNGHKKLLSLAASVTKDVLTVGITSSTMLAKKKGADQIEPVEQRVRAVKSFLEEICPGLKLNIVVIEDPYGPPVHDPDFDAIMVSSETIGGAAKINEIRQSKNMKPLEIVVTRRTVSSLLSSTFMRNNVPRRRTAPGQTA